MTETPKKRGRPAKPVLTVKKADTIHDGKGGFYPVGHVIEPVDADAAEQLKARGLIG